LPDGLICRTRKRWFVLATQTGRANARPITACRARRSGHGNDRSPKSGRATPSGDREPQPARQSAAAGPRSKPHFLKSRRTGVWSRLYSPARLVAGHLAINLFLEDWKMSADSSHLPTIDAGGMPANRLDTGMKLISLLSADPNDSSPSPIAVTEFQKLFREYSELRALEDVSPETRKEILEMARSRQRSDQWVQRAGAFFPFWDIAARAGAFAVIIWFSWHLAETGHDWLAGVALGSGGLAAAAGAFLQRLKG